MSGWEVIGLVLALYPIVETAVKLYGEAKPGHTASCLIRKLKTEALIYDQFVRNLLEPVVSTSVIERLLDRSSSDIAGTWRDGELHKELLDRLGPIKSSHLLDLLLDMNKRLKALEIELTNISRGTEVLEKFRTRLRAARANSPKSRVQMNLIAVSEINRDLRRLLEADAISISHPITQCKASRPECIRFLHRENIDLRELYDIMRHGYDCTCDEPHLATLGCHCPSCQAPFSPTKTSSSCWTPELILWPNTTTDSEPESTISTNGKEKAFFDDKLNEANTMHKARATSLPAPELRSLSEASQKRRSCSISVSPCRESGHSDKKEVIQDLCAAINNFQGEAEQKEAILGVLQKENKKYRLSINKGQSTEEGANDILRTSDLIKTGSPALSTKKRLQIAFQLCLAVLQLCTTPWIDNSWTWDEHCFVRKIEVQIDEKVEEEEYSEPRDDAYSLFVTQQFYSSQLAVPRSEITKPDTILNLLVGEPTGFVLVKLGCALIELGFGKSMQDIRDEKPSNWLGGLEKTLDPASLDFVTASKLLDSGSVKAEVGIDYANVVKACINRQYQDAQESCIKEFSFRGEKFFDCAEEAIMNPLFDWVKVFG